LGLDVSLSMESLPGLLGSPDGLANCWRTAGDGAQSDLEAQTTPVRDDYSLFPEDEYGTYYNDGYTVSVGNDWIGYVCPNSETPSGVCL
jgi:hypothetical protein